MIWDSVNNAANHEAYLSAENIAAIIPQQQPDADSRFLVTLKNGKSFEVVAEHFEISDAEVKSYNRFMSRDKQLEDAYLAASETVMVMPAYWLDRNWYDPPPFSVPG